MAVHWGGSGGGASYPNFGQMTQVQLHAAVSIANNSFADFSWSASDIVSDPLVSWASGSPAQFKVPAGYTKVRLNVNAIWATQSTGNRWILFYLNGGTGTLIGDDVRGGQNEAGSTLVTPWITGLTGGTSFFTLQFAQSSGAALNLLGATGLSEATRLQLEWAA